MVGQNIGKYRVLERVGRGGMGTVYRAIDETLHREVAIKVLNAELNDPEVAKRFRAEAITVARLSHPGIATIYELFQHEGQWLMVMEFVRGETLERVVERAGAQTAERAAELCMQSLAALAHAHSMGVVHRDLKPANIMVTESGTVKIMDFGIARVAGTEHLTNAGFMMGTPAYMAPEQVLGHEIDARADIYALGVVFYRLVTAQLPFRGETPFAMAQAQVNNQPTPVRTVRADLPPWVDEVMTRSLAKKPEERFQSAVEFHEALARCLSGRPIEADYRSSAPSGVVSTPPRAMSTGSIEQAAPAPPVSGALPASSGAVPIDPSTVAPTMAGTPVATMRPSAASDAVSPEAAVTVATPVMGTNAAPAATAPATVPPRVGAKGGALRGGPRKSTTGLVAAAIAVVVLLGAGFAWLHKRRAAPPVEPAQTAAATADAAAGQTSSAPPSGDASNSPAIPPNPAAAPAAPPAAAGPTGTTRGSSSPPGTPAPTGAAASGSAGPASASVPGSAPVTDAANAASPALPASSVTPASGRAGTAGRGSVDDSHLVIPGDVKYVAVNGKKTDDEDAIVSFWNGQIAVMSKKDGQPVATWPYRSVLSATYIKARDPRWDSAYASPPDDLDVGGFLRTSKHWLILQNRDAFILLRLSDANVTRMLETVEARCGIAVSRPTGDAADK
jgi:serine/threonine protein kinase